MKEKINPDHYKSEPFECISFTRLMSFCQGNAFKYVWRLGMKDNIKQEAEKAVWYIKECIISGPDPRLCHHDRRHLQMKLAECFNLQPLKQEILELLIAQQFSAAYDLVRLNFIYGKEGE